MSIGIGPCPQPCRRSRAAAVSSPASSIQSSKVHGQRDSMTRKSMERQSEARLFRRSPAPPDTTPILTIQVLRRDINQVHAISQRNISIFNTRAQYTYIQQLLESSHPPGRHHRHRHLILPSRLRHPASSRSLDRGTHVPREAEPGPRLHEAEDFFYLIESVCWTSGQRKLERTAQPLHRGDRLYIADKSKAMDLANAYRYLWGATTGSFPRNEIHYILRCKDDVEWRQELATITNAILKMRQEDSDLATVVKWGVTDLIDSTHSLLLWLDMPDIPGFRQLTRDPCIDHHSFSAAFVADVVMEYGHYDYIVLWWSGRQPERSTEQKIRGLTAMVQSHVVQLMYFISSWYGMQGDLKLREILTAGHHLQDNGLTALEDAIQLMGPLLQVVQKTHSVLFVLESPFDGVSPEETNRMVESLRHWIDDANEELYTRDDVKVLVTGSGWRHLRGNNALKASEKLCYMPVQICISDQETALGEARELVRGALLVGEKEESAKNYHPDSDGDGSG